MTSRSASRLISAVTLVIGVATAIPAGAQWQLDSKDGKSFVKFGFLAQPQAEWLEVPASDGWAQNLFLRRFRILFGGTLGEKWTFFFETDSPNVGRANPDPVANPTGAKNEGDIFLQDVVISYEHSDAFKIDAGLLLFPVSRNHQQSAASLLPIDYGPYTFLESVPVGERVGRDYGIESRGYPWKKKLEYRFGIFQGVRGVEARNPLRVVGRLVYYPFGGDTGFFYPGTYQGSRRQVGIGASFDRQRDYHVYSGDLFVELPLKGMVSGFTAQVGYTHFDGARLTRVLTEQNTFLIEVGVHLDGGRWTPFVQYAIRDFEPAVADQDFVQAGLAYWMKGHNRNIKAGVARFATEGQPSRAQVVVQFQVFYF